jgi:hypothetical protein
MGSGIPLQPLQPRGCVDGDPTKLIPRFSIIGSFRVFRGHKQKVEYFIRMLISIIVACGMNGRCSWRCVPTRGQSFLTSEKVSILTKDDRHDRWVWPGLGYGLRLRAAGERALMFVVTHIEQTGMLETS